MRVAGIGHGWNEDRKTQDVFSNFLRNIHIIHTNNVATNDPTKYRFDTT